RRRRERAPAAAGSSLFHEDGPAWTYTESSLGPVGGGARRRQSPRASFLARLGATRGGSFGCLGYTGGHGASISPLARSRSYIASSGSIDCARSYIPAQGSPSRATRPATTGMVSWSGWNRS